MTVSAGEATSFPLLSLVDDAIVDTLAGEGKQSALFLRHGAGGRIQRRKLEHSGVMDAAMLARGLARDQVELQKFA